MPKAPRSTGSRVTERARLVVFAVGNESRGDDALGPALLARLEAILPPGARTVPDFQLQIEDALELREADLALFIDAAVGLTRAFDFHELAPAEERSAFSHALSPASVLQVFASIERRAPPPAFALALRASRFELGEPLSALAGRDLEEAFAFAAQLLADPDAESWRERARGAGG